MTPVTIITRSSRLYLRWKDPHTGKRREQLARTTSEREAWKLAGLKEDELRNAPALPQTSFQSFLDHYDAEVMLFMARNSATKALAVLNAFYEAAKPESVSLITTAHINAYTKSLYAANLAKETIRGYLACLKAALNWAKLQGMLATVPHIAMPKRRKGEAMKGRPITTEEFERLLDACQRVFGRVEAEAYYRLISGLWASGLRLGEALALRYEQHDGMWIDFSGRRPMLVVPAHAEKGRRDRLCPIAPEFCGMLDGTEGFVFPLPGNPSLEDVSRAVSKIGKMANVVVRIEGGKVKYASAHDLRRSFCERWAYRPGITPQILMQLMRHESIETTQRYYVGRNAQMTSDILWDAVKTSACPALTERAQSARA